MYAHGILSERLGARDLSVGFTQDTRAAVGIYATSSGSREVRRGAVQYNGLLVSCDHRYFQLGNSQSVGLQALQDILLLQDL